MMRSPPSRATDRKIRRRSEACASEAEKRDVASERRRRRRDRRRKRGPDGRHRVTIFDVRDSRERINVCDNSVRDESAAVP